MMQQKLKKQMGFTILELLIATVVVSAILVLVTTVMIGIQNVYDKGVNQQRAQDNVRNIVDQIVQEIQAGNSTIVQPNLGLGYSFKANFNGTLGSYQVQAVCVGTVRWVYIIGLQVGTSVQQALWRDTTPETGCQSNVPNIRITTNGENGVEYIASGSRLTDFEVIAPTGSDPNYTIKASLAVGKDDLLSTNNSYNAVCNDGTGQQYCATARLTTEVSQRQN